MAVKESSHCREPPASSSPTISPCSHCTTVHWERPKHPSIPASLTFVFNTPPPKERLEADGDRGLTWVPCPGNNKALLDAQATGPSSATSLSPTAAVLPRRHSSVSSSSSPHYPPRLVPSQSAGSVTNNSWASV